MPHHLYSTVLFIGVEMWFWYTESERKNKKKKSGRLWEFIRNLLLDPSTCPSLVRWENAEEGMFRFIQAEKVAQKWGDRKKNGEMNYEKLSRAMR